LLCLLVVPSAWSQTGNLLQRAQRALDAGDSDTAVQLFDEARSNAPNDPRAWSGLAVAYLKAGRPANAEAVASAALQHWPRSAEILHWRGLARFQQQKIPEAAADLKQAKSIGDSPDLDFDLALVYLTAGDYSSAANELESAARGNPNSALTHLLLGRAYQNTNRTTEALEQFRTALRLDPNIKLGHYHLGFALASLGKVQEGIAEMKLEISRNGATPEVDYQLGHYLMEAGENDEALPHLESAARAGYSDAFYDLGKLQLAKSDAAAAVSSLEQYVTRVPDSSSGYFLLWRALQKTGDQAKAQAALDRFQELKRAKKQEGGMATGRIH
jgi:tetratricopeptide (TPR) repeat protein